MAKTKKNAGIADKTIKLLKEKNKKRKIAAAKPKPVRKPKPVPKPAAQKAEPPKVFSKAKYSKEDLNYFKSIILEKKKEIIEELETLRDTMMDSTTGEYATENSTYSTHMEQGTDAMEREKTFLFASREGKFLNHLEDALVRIDKGEYGRCTGCGKLIEKERLEAVPHAQQCLQCKLKSQK
ncbi:MAG: TraR/DksA C4-type zinc finger protein [Ignavibacteriales bacterium]|nr:TraR/DksA C4-type zinc finger protein [Ignavibacteriales bacterium]